MPPDALTAPVASVAVNRPNLRGAFLAALGALLALCATIVAQEPEPTPIPETQPSPPEFEVPLPSPEASPRIPPALPEEPAVEINGRPIAPTPRRLHYAFSVVLREVYDDNIGISRDEGGSDFYTSIEPTIRLTLGDKTEGQGYNALEFVYAPNAVFFANNSQFDALQHVIHFDAQRVFGKLTLNLNVDVQLLDGTDLRSLTDTTGRQANLDVGQRSRHQIYTGNLSASYDLSSKTFLSGAMNYIRSDYSQFIGSEILSGNVFLNFNYSSKTVLGVGATLGYNSADEATPDQHYEQVNLRATYNPSEKLSVAASAGIEFRQFEGNSRGLYTSPVYELNAVYKPFDSTSISVDGSRRTQSSAALAGSDYSSTDIHFTAQQRFFQRLFLSLSAGYQNAEYFSVLSGDDVPRSDNYYYFQLAVDGNITRFWHAGFYYLHREDASSLESFSFSDNQIGFRTVFVF